ncbi:hypothetical protein BDV30DRAFT_216439 [Aspergillus minisclerotigenes]|uniref:Uncharacterized protein n=1 Tax=Aspergillus minisclerotigenes TaxID=656917 RepID=A0A5N6ITQ7_9EURO|nr:hypothetical protein BDV30DRAFT_216439 [Aspergillus minisclerotigenes]
MNFSQESFSLSLSLFFFNIFLFIDYILTHLGYPPCGVTGWEPQDCERFESKYFRVPPAHHCHHHHHPRHMMLLVGW